MKCDAGRLQAYLDGALPAPEGAAVAAHLESCAACRETLESLRRQGALAAVQMQRLDPPASQEPQRERALARFWQQVRPVERRAQRSSWTARLLGTSRARRIGRPEQHAAGPNLSTLTARWRPALIALSVVAVIAILFSFAPVRQAAADFLGLFRVRKFAVVPVDPGRLEQLAGLEDLVLQALGEPVMLREPGRPEQVEDAAAAAALAGFSVRAPAYLPADAVLLGWSVESGPAVRVDVDRDRAQELLEGAGIADINLPDAETLAVTADIAPIVSQVYRVGEGTMALLQSPSPEVTLPGGLDMTQMGEALLRMLGTPEAEARRLAQEIDWTGTLIIPLPTNLAQFREVAVDGTTGLLLEYTGQAETGEPEQIVLWERDGIVYVVGGYHVAVDELLRVADSLQ